jgi:hypothetical protein
MKPMRQLAPISFGFIQVGLVESQAAHGGVTLIDAISFAVVAATGLFLVTLGILSLATPALVSRFLLGFARSPFKHYVELAVRFLVGGAFLVSAPRAQWPAAFRLFGWALVVTTAGLFFLPWRWHHRFAQWAVPEALRFLPLVGVASVVLGGMILWAALHGHAA